MTVWTYSPELDNGTNMLLDIVILPPKRLREQLGRRIVQATKGLPTFFVVDNKKFIPHVSLFHIRSSGQKLKNLVKEIPKLVKNYKPVKLRFKKFDIGGEVGRAWFGLGLNKSKQLLNLHEKIVYSCYKYRTDMMPLTSKRASKLDKEYRKNFGSRHILKLFHPHITMAMLKNLNDSRMVSRKMKTNLKFEANEIALTEVNYWHQVTKIIKIFKLAAK